MSEDIIGFVLKTGHRATIEYDIPENRIVVRPPLSAAGYTRLVDEGLIPSSSAKRSWNSHDSDPRSCIPFGKFILEGTDMDEATVNRVEELNKYFQGDKAE